MKTKAGAAGTSARAVEYPESDGKPMAESDTHRKAMQHDAIEVLEDWFAGDPRVYVAGNNFLYYEEGNPRRCVSPDCYIVKGVPKGDRRSFMTWQEGGARPCFVLEVTSRKTRLEDLGEKMAKYRDDLGVREYFLFDPTAGWIKEQLRGFRLEDGVYAPVERTGDGWLASVELGLELAASGHHLRVRAPGAPKPLPTRKEQIANERAEKERERAAKERERAEKERERAEKERERAEKERERAERQRAEARAKAAEDEVRRLRAELARARSAGRRRKR